MTTKAATATDPLALGCAIRNALEELSLPEWQIHYNEPWFTIRSGPVNYFTAEASMIEAMANNGTLTTSLRDIFEESSDGQ